MQYTDYKKDFTRAEVAPEIETVKKFMSEHNSAESQKMSDFKGMMAKFGPEVQNYYDAVVAMIKDKGASGEKMPYFRACCQNPEGKPGIPCKCYQGSQKYIAAVQYILADKAAGTC